MFLKILSAVIYALLYQTEARRIDAGAIKQIEPNIILRRAILAARDFEIWWPALSADIASDAARRREVAP